MEDEKKWLPGTTIVSRLLMIGEDLVPEEWFAKMTGDDYRIWFTEPDPDKFPPEMKELADFVREHEEPMEPEEEEEEEEDEEPEEEQNPPQPKK